MLRQIFFKGLFLFFIGLLSGCQIEPDPVLQSLVEQDMKTKLQISEIETIPEVKKWEPYRYGASHLRSPFEMGNLAQLDKPAVEHHAQHQEESARAKELLELYPLDSLKMVGIIQKEDLVFGLVRDNGGHIHRVKALDYIGQNEGIIETIDEKGIGIREKHYKNSLEPEEKLIILPFSSKADGS